MILIIIVTRYDVLSLSTKFFYTSQKGSGIADVNYLVVKNDVTH